MIEHNISIDSTQASKIKLLPEHLIDQIKAGEVVERPALALKELLENSLDAQATELSIHIEDAGLGKIIISDNGKGMDFNDLPWAFTRHATSKISRFEDLYSLSSFGFRGEALASIASVSRVTCQSSKGINNQEGGKITLEGQNIISHLPFHSEKSGTSIIVSDLFFNTPVRLNFVKSKTSEKNALKKIIDSYLLKFPEVKFSISKDQEEKKIYPALDKTDFKTRAMNLWKIKSEDEILEIKKEYQNITIHCLISLKPSSGQSKGQFIFANGRPFIEKGLHQVVSNCMEYIWGSGKSGAYALFINVPSNRIDVNVHPNKTQIKFLDQSLIFSLISSSIKATLPENKSPSGFYNNLNHVSASEQLGLKPTFSNSPPVNTTIEKFSTSNKPSSEMSLLEIAHNKYLLKLSNDFEIGFIDSTNILTQFFTENYSKVKKLDSLDTILIPLIVAYPFNSSSASQVKLAFMNEIGLLTDSLSENQSIIRTIPQFLSTFSLQEIMSLLEGLNPEMILKIKAGTNSDEAFPVDSVHLEQSLLVRILEKLEKIPCKKIDLSNLI